MADHSAVSDSQGMSTISSQVADYSAGTDSPDKSAISLPPPQASPTSTPGTGTTSRSPTLACPASGGRKSPSPSPTIDKRTLETDMIRTEILEIGEEGRKLDSGKEITKKEEGKEEEAGRGDDEPE